MRRYLLILAAVLAVSFSAPMPARNEPGADTGKRFHVGHYGDVRALCRVGDSLWVGTGGGVFVYDLGSSEIADHITIGEGLPSNSIRAISALGDSVFVGTDGGLSVITPDTAVVYTDSSPGPFGGSPLGLIRRVDFGLDSRVYLSTYGRGLGVLHAGTAWVITREDSLLDDKVFGMVQEDDTTFYFATSTGLCAYRDSVWVSFRAGAGIPRAEIRQVERAPDGGFYMVVGRRGIYWFDGERAKRITYPALFPENAVAGIAVDTRGSLWACGAQGGVAVYRNGHWNAFGSADDDYGSRSWRSAAADSLDGVFFGSADGRVLWIREDVATDIRLPEGLPSGGVQSMTADSTGAIYVLNGSYLLRMDREINTVSIEHTAPIVVTFAVSPQGELWTATRWGIYRRDGGRYVGLEARLSERQPIFSAIGFDAQGSLWVGTQAGNVHRYDGQIWMRMANAGDLNVGAIRAIDVDGWGRLWVTGSNGGVAVYRYSRWTRFGPPAYGDRPARQIAVAPNGEPVLATEAGLWGYDDAGSWKAVQLDRPGVVIDSTGTNVWEAGSPSILSLGFDPAGRIYVGTEGGIAAIDKTGTRWFTYKDGIGGEAITSVLANGAGEVWIGFRSDGLTRLSVDAAPDIPERD